MWNVLATLWWDKLHEMFHSVTYPATAKIDARQVATAVAESRIKFYFSCNLSRIVAKTVLDKLHKTFHSVTGPLKYSNRSR